MIGKRLQPWSMNFVHAAPLRKAGVDASSERSHRPMFYVLYNSPGLHIFMRQLDANWGSAAALVFVNLCQGFSWQTFNYALFECLLSFLELFFFFTIRISAKWNFHKVTVSTMLLSLFSYIMFLFHLLFCLSLNFLFLPSWSPSPLFILESNHRLTKG